MFVCVGIGRMNIRRHRHDKRVTEIDCIHGIFDIRIVAVHSIVKFIKPKRAFARKRIEMLFERFTNVKRDMR